jgi:two-component system OmpR family sensor kinase
MTPTRGELLLWLLAIFIWRIATYVLQRHRISRSMEHDYQTILSDTQQLLIKQRQFHAFLAHELRNPMTSLALQNDQLTKLPLNARARVHVRHLSRGIQRISELLEQLLCLARSQNKSDEGHDSGYETCVEESLRLSIEQLLPQLENRLPCLNFEQYGPAKVNIPAFDLQTILRNLLENAIRHTPSNSKIEITISRLSQFVLIQIADNGHGIPNDLLEKVLNPFYRLNTQTQGSGLGLAIVNTLVVQAGGQIDLCNRTQGGLMVSIQLPKARNEGILCSKKTVFHAYENLVEGCNGSTKHHAET